MKNNKKTKTSKKNNLNSKKSSNVVKMQTDFVSKNFIYTITLSHIL